jgi:hypothetical protein
MNLSEYWRRVRAIQASLPVTVWLTSDGKNLTECDSETAAEPIVRGELRIATDLEIALFKARRSVLDSQYRDAVALRNRGGFVLELTK